MIYFIQNKTTAEIKIGYSQLPKRRLGSLNTSSPHELVLLGQIQGGLELEKELHNRFAKHHTKGEWFKGAILSDVLGILARDAANPQPTKVNVIVSGSSEANFMWSSDRDQAARKEKLRRVVHQGLTDIHAKTPIASVIIGGNRQLEVFAAEWAKLNKVMEYEYFPDRRQWPSAAAQLARKMLRAMFDNKVLFVLLGEKESVTTTRLIRYAEKMRISVVQVTNPAVQQTVPPA